MGYDTNMQRRGPLPGEAVGPALPFLSVLFFCLAACADPRPPTGGAPDRTPPTLEETIPEPEAVNVTGTSVRLNFSEYVDQASFGRALSMTPAPEGRLRFKWRKRRVEIRFPEPLRDNTTYVLTIDANLRDAHGVALQKPITFAFSTGPVINKGHLTGRVLDPTRGEGVAGLDVFAYAVPDTMAPGAIPERPDYRTQTDDSGQFSFSFLREQPYFVLVLQDRNRNRRPDANEPFAVPTHPALPADTTQAADARRWLVAVLDTVPPVVQRARPLSNRRLSLRFSEAVQLTALTPDGWLLEDSLSGLPAAVQAAYLQATDPRQVYLLTDSLRPFPYRLRPSAAVTDSSGNAAAPDPVRFTPAAEADTVQLRFLGFVPSAGAAGEVQRLAPLIAPGVRFNQPVPPPRFAEIVTAQDTAGQALSFETTTPDGTTYHLHFTPALQPGHSVQLRVAGQRAGAVDTVYTRTFRRIVARELGSLSGVVAADDTSGRLVVELYPTEGENVAQPYAVTHPDTTGHFSFGDLPEGPYRFRVFVDRDGNDRWDGGLIVPYRPAEPVAWATGAVRPRWDSALEDTLRIGSNF